MADSDAACTLKVKADGRVEMQCAGSKYRSKLLDDRRAQAVVERLDRLAKVHPAVCEQEDLQLLGETLFDILFGQPVTQLFEPFNQPVQEFKLDGSLRDAFLRIIDDHKDRRRGGPLRLRLVFEPDADKWANLPWEFLYASRAANQGFFVAGEETSLSLTRIIEPPVDREPPPLNPPHMLLILSQPRELNFELTPELFEQLQGHICSMLSLPRDCLEPMNKPAWETLARRLTDKTKPVPDIIHFIGHGRFLNGESQIAVHRSKVAMDADRGRNPQQEPIEADWHNVHDLSAQLAGRAPWLFFLQTCSSGRPDPGFGAFRSAAQQIAQADVPFVVAMQYEIAAEDARKFSDTFYAALGTAASVDEAVMRGRAALGKLPPAYGHPRFGTPVVYLRSESRFLLKPAALGSSKPAAPSLWPQHCPAYDCDKLLYDKRRRCGCARKIALVYCDAGHANVAGEDKDCVVHDCMASLEGLPAIGDSAAPQRREQR